MLSAHNVPNTCTVLYCNEHYSGLMQENSIKAGGVAYDRCDVKKEWGLRKNMN